MKLLESAPEVLNPQTNEPLRHVGSVTDKLYAINGLVLVRVDGAKTKYAYYDPDAGGVKAFLPVAAPQRTPDERSSGFRKYMIDVGWAYRRQQALKRDNYRCVRCSSYRDLQVHHKIHRSKQRIDKLENLETLCYTCHGPEHGQ